MNDTINISSKKTQFWPKFTSSPTDGVVVYTCPSFFNTTGGTINYTGETIQGEIEIYANENLETASRQGDFKLTATTNSSEDYDGTAEVTCAWTVTQEAAPITPRLELTTLVPDIPANATAIIYTIKSNVATTVKYEEQTHTHNATEGETNSFTVPINESQDPVLHVITAYCTDSPSVSETLTFTQAGDDYVFSVSPTELHFAYNGGLNILQIDNPNNYNWEITGIPDWLVLAPTAHTQQGGLNTVTVVTSGNTGNERSCTLMLNETTYGRSHIEIEVSQDAALPTTFTLTFTSQAGASSISYTSEMGKTGSNVGTPVITNWSVTGFSDGDVVTWHAKKTGYFQTSGTVTMNSDKTVALTFSNSMLFFIGPDDTSDTAINGFNVAASSTQMPEQQLTFNNVSGNGVTKTYTLPSSFDDNGNDTFKFVLNKIYGSVNITNWKTSGTIQSRTLPAGVLPSYLNSVPEMSAKTIYLKYVGNYMTEGSIEFVSQATQTYVSLDINASNDQKQVVKHIASFTGNSETKSFEYDTRDTTRYHITIGGAILDQSRYSNFSLQITNGSETFYNGPAKYLVPTDPDYTGQHCQMTLLELTGSKWVLHDIA